MRVDEQIARPTRYRRGLWVRHHAGRFAARCRARARPTERFWSTATFGSTAERYIAQATALAHSLMTRMPPGSVVSFMLPNWHEAAVIYLAATLAGMVVNPILPSLRDHELRFILDDADSRVIFVPADFGRHDYVGDARPRHLRRWPRRPR